MSVLLDALKKAAENKKQSEVPENPEQDAVLSPEKPEMVSSGQEPVSQPESQEGLGLKLINEEHEQSAPRPPSIDDLDEEADTLKNVSDNVQPSSAVNSASEEESVQEESSIANKAVESESKEALPSTEGVSGSFQEESAQTEVDSEISSEPLEQGVSKKQAAGKGESADESYEWSLSSLPGYQGEETRSSESSGRSAVQPPVPESDINPVLSAGKRFPIGGGLSLRNVLFGRSSETVVYLLFMFLFVSFLAFFSVLYYQDQNVKLEKSMQRYEIVQIEPKPLPEESTKTEEPAETQRVVAEEERKPSSEVQERQPDTDMLTAQQTEEEKVAPTQVAELETAAVSKTAEPTVTKPRKSVPKPVQYEQTLTRLETGPARVLNIQSVKAQSDVNHAYEALYSGKYDLAQKEFEAIVERDEGNIAALNGLGAVYSQQGNDVKAQEHYYQVLNLDPDNLHAFEAVISLSGVAIQGQEWKQELLRVLEKHPNSAVLNQALGNIYAHERDWEKAQTYFFDSYALDKQNPDYLVNLAISLDRLGQYSLAAQYYALALVHADSGAINFDVQTVKLRLASIKQFIEKTGL